MLQPWMNLDIMLSEISQIQKDKYCMNALISKVVKFIEIQSIMVVTRVWGGRIGEGRCYLMGIVCSVCKMKTF